MKRKILILMPSMFIGGAERSLIGLLEAIDYGSFHVDLFLYRHQGEFLSYIPETVNLLPEIKAYTTFDRPIRELLTEGSLHFAIARIMSKIALRIRCIVKNEKDSGYKSMQYTSRYLLPLLPRIRGEYDLAVNFIGMHHVLINKVSAKVKTGWMHTDYTRIDPFLKMDEKMWSGLDYAVNVSEECTRAFQRGLPHISHKCITIENIISEKFVRSQAHEDVSQEMPDMEGELKLCSVGRFCEAKNFDNVPDICKRIIEKNHKIKWYLIGYGTDEGVIREKIKENGMEENVIILGKKVNPYPYINACDIYVQPSRYEGKAVTVREAQILCKPVIITDFETSGSQLEDGVDGIVVPMDNEGCAEGIKSLIENKDLQQKLVENCKKRNYGNESEVQKIYSLLMKAEGDVYGHT